MSTSVIKHIINSNSYQSPGIIQCTPTKVTGYCSEQETKHHIQASLIQKEFDNQVDRLKRTKEFGNESQHDTKAIARWL